MEKLNRDRAQALFEKHAILFGDRDAIPEETAIQLLGKDAVEFARDQDNGGGRTWNAYGIGDAQADYLTFKGFLIACTYSNISSLKEEAEEPEDAEEVDIMGEESVIRAVLAMFLDYMDRVADAGKTADTDEDNAKLFAALEEATGAKREGMLAKLFLAYGNGFNDAVKALSAGAEKARAKE